MAKCEFCGVEVELPFQCNYCGKRLCESHRLLENHDCPNAPERTPLGSHQTKVALATFVKQRIRNDIQIPNLSVTYDNKHGHRFSVPPEVYLDETFYNKLNEARTLEEVEDIIHDYYEHHPKNERSR